MSISDFLELVENGRSYRLWDIRAETRASIRDDQIVALHAVMLLRVVNFLVRLSATVKHHVEVASLSQSCSDMSKFPLELKAYHLGVPLFLRHRIVHENLLHVASCESMTSIVKEDKLVWSLIDDQASHKFIKLGVIDLRDIEDLLISCTN